MKTINIELRKAVFTATELQGILDSVHAKIESGYTGGIFRDHTEKAIAVFAISGIQHIEDASMRPYYIKSEPKSNS